jgi:integrase
MVFQTSVSIAFLLTLSEHHTPACGLFVLGQAVRTVTRTIPAIRRAAHPPHDLRHAAASLAVSAGANVKAIEKMLGHASVATTLDIYADLLGR